MILLSARYKYNNDGTIGFPKTSFWNYHYSLRNNPEERSLKKSIALLSQQYEVYLSPGSAVNDDCDDDGNDNNNNNNNNNNFVLCVLSR